MTKASSRVQRPWDLLNFHWPWRDYQHRVLDEIDVHLADRRLHVVAAPGSGKTILGLEAFRRLRRRAVALSPTRTIRDQWVARLADFLPDDQQPSTVASTDFEANVALYSLTYQSLHSRARAVTDETPEDVEDETSPNEREPVPGNTELTALQKAFVTRDIGVLILDEAHHLHAAWWDVLNTLIEGLDDVVVICLTATPPYDIQGSDWERYMTLCGPVDAHIAVPELVKTGTLCPHQDYVFATRAGDDERQALEAHDARVNRVAESLLADEVFIAAVARHPLVSDAVSIERLFDAPELAFALLSTLARARRPISTRVLQLLGISATELPAFSPRWLQVLVHSYLWDADWPDRQTQTADRERLAGALRTDGLLKGRQLRIDDAFGAVQILSRSGAKIAACVRIHEIERGQRGDQLRQVFLTDYIRDETLDDTAPAEAPLLGAWPLFQALVQASDPAHRTDFTLVTGRLVIVHKDRLEALLPQHVVSTDTKPVPSCPDFRIVPIRGQALVAAITALLASDALRVVVGTRALLGEGWDAPSINSLILASYVGAYVSTNQMRGRAIRSDRNQPDKTASIWHIAAVEPGTAHGRDDLLDLYRRFDTFIGLDTQDARIENGIDRLHLNLPALNLAGISSEATAALNRRTQTRLEQDRTTLAAQWQHAITGATVQRLAPSAVPARGPRLARYVFANHLPVLSTQIISVFGGALTSAIAAKGGFLSLSQPLSLWLLAGFTAAFIATLPRMVRLLRLWKRYLSRRSSLVAMGEVVKAALCESRLIRTSAAALHIHDSAYRSETAISLDGGTLSEQSLFADCMAEMLGAIANPRYLISRTNAVRPNAGEWYAVPQALGTHKTKAETLLRHWHEIIGAGELVFTRYEDGRAAILAARGRSLAHASTPRNIRRDIWS